METMSFDELHPIIDNKHDEMDAKMLYETVLKWVKYDQDSRTEYSYQLIKHVDFETIDEEYLREHVVKEKIITKSLRVMLNLNPLLIPDSSREPSVSSLDSSLPEDKLLLVGG